MKKNLTTPAGQVEPESKNDRVNAINQIFALFRRNYHNQYYRALPNDEELAITKRLWLDALGRFTPETIMQAAKNLVESSEFFPTLRTMIQHCESTADPGLPDAHSAYIEACRAPSPKATHNWSHPIVYHAGKNCDWFFLQSNSENIAFPVFKEEYQKLCQRIRQGEILSPPSPTALPETPVKVLDKSRNLQHLETLKKHLDL